jgi:hypothetical protein
MDPEEAFESFRQALRESSLKDDHTGDFGVEAAVAAFDECLALARTEERERLNALLETVREPLPL